MSEVGAVGRIVTLFLFLFLLLSAIEASGFNQVKNEDDMNRFFTVARGSDFTMKEMEDGEYRITGSGDLEINGFHPKESPRFLDFDGFDNVVFNGSSMKNSPINEEIEIRSSGKFIIENSEIEINGLTLDAPVMEIRDSEFKGCGFWFTTVTGNLTNSTFSDGELHIMTSDEWVWITDNIFDNTIVEATWGRYLHISRNLFINGSTTLYTGAPSHIDKLTIITNNTFESCTGLDFSEKGNSPIGPQYISDVHIRYNEIKNCTNGMVFNHDTYGNNIRISHNWFYHNRGTGDNGSVTQIGPYDWNPSGVPFDIQFYENGTGNCWQNHRTPDSDKDGIVDIPYDLSDQDWTLKDEYPLTSRYYGLLPPVVTITSPDSGSDINLNFTLEWEIEDHGVPIKNATLKIGNMTPKDVFGLNRTNVTVKPGSYDLRLEVIDVSGLKGNDTLQIQTLYKKNMVKFIPLGEGWITIDDPEVRWVIDEILPVHRQEMLIDGETLELKNSDRSLRSELSDGYHNLEIRAYDSYGYVFNDSMMIRIDTTRPLIDLESPRNGSVFSTYLVTFRWEVIEEQSLAVIRYRIDGEDWKVQKGPEMVMGQILETGGHYLEIEASDEAGWSASLRSEFSIGSDMNRCIIEPASDLITNKDTVTIRWVEPNWMDVLRSEIYVKESGSMVNVTGKEVYESDLERGPNTVHVRFYDRFDNYYSENVLVIFDDAPPSVEINDKSKYVNESDLMVGWYGYDEYGISGYQFSLDNGTWSVLSSGVTALLADLEEGAHYFKVKATDVAGNSITAGWYFIVDTLTPDLFLTAPGNGEMARGPKITLEWDVEDENGIEEVNLSVDGKLSHYSGSDDKTVSLRSGIHTVIVSATDPARNSVSIKRWFILDNHDPAVYWDMKTPEVLRSEYLVLSWNETDDVGIVKRTIHVNGIPVSNPDRNLAVLQLDEGEKEIVVTVTDGVDGNASISWDPIIDRTPPEKIELRYQDKKKGFDVIGSFRDNLSDVVYVDLLINGEFIQRFTDSINYHHQVDIDGPINITATAFDIAGNNETFTLQIEEEKEDVDAGGGIPLWVILLILLVIFLAVISVFLTLLFIKRRHETEGEVEEEEKSWKKPPLPGIEGMKRKELKERNETGGLPPALMSENE